MANLWLKTGDLLPPATATLTDDDGPVDLSGVSTVRFLMRPIRDSLTVIDELASVDDALTGQVSYSWQPGDTDIAGGYIGEFQVEFSPGVPETFPNDGYVTIAILESLTEAAS